MLAVGGYFFCVYWLLGLLLCSCCDVWLVSTVCCLLVGLVVAFAFVSWFKVVVCCVFSGRRYDFGGVCW